LDGPAGRVRSRADERVPPEIGPIRSSANQVLKYVRSLGRRSIRRTERAFVVEGVRAVTDAVEAGAVPTHLLLRDEDELPPALGPSVDNRTTLVRVVAADLFDELCETVHPQGVLAVFPFPDLSVSARRAPLFLVIDGLRDPGNLGTLLRSAAAAGVTAAFVAAETVDPFNAKVVRAGMGAHFRLPIRDLDDDGIAMMRELTHLRAIARVGDAPPPDALDWRQPATLIVSSETGRESGIVERLATVGVAIPMAAGVESLNAAVAGSVILFEAARQRRRGGLRGAIPSGR
jgi:RNA methyltransferase, TrmH family